MLCDKLRSDSSQIVNGSRLSIRVPLISSATSLILFACAPSEMIPGNSYTRANSSLAVQSWEATAVLALAAVPSCDQHDLTNTEVVSVQEPLKIEGARATQGKWVEKWTYDICGTAVPVKVEYEVDELGTGYQASLW